MRFPSALLGACLVFAVGALPSRPAKAQSAPPSINARTASVAALRTRVETGMLEWMRDAARPFAAAEPTTAELAPLLDALGTGRLIGLGEITHGTHEDLVFKAAVIRGLVARGGIDTLVFEVNRRTGERLDRFVARGSRETDAAAAMREAKVYAIWMTHELADLLDWLRRWNGTAAAPVRIVGVDVQDASSDLADALAALEPVDAKAAARLRAALADWVSPESLGRHQSQTIATLDAARWASAHAAAMELERALAQVPGAGRGAANAGRHGVHMMEYDVPGKAGSVLDIPDDVFSRRDIAMAERALEAVPRGRRGLLWAHDSHVLRTDAPYGFGYTTVGAYLHHALGREDYRTLTFSARVIDFNAKGTNATRQPDRTTPFSTWRYTSGPDDLGTFLARTGHPRFWLDLRRLPAGEAGLLFPGMAYGRPSFGWAVLEEMWPVLPLPFGYGTDVLVHSDQLTPSRRLP